MSACRPARRIRVAAVLAAGLVAATTLLLAPPAKAAVPGYVRLAHWSPDTPEVDVWVTSFKGSSFSKVFPAVGYGTVSDYQRLTPGVYTVAMRSPGAAKNSQPLLRTNVTVEPSGAYTVAGVGLNADVALKVLNDDLTRPSAGTARMRVVQASSVAPVVSVATTEGTTIAADAQFPSATDYREVAAQQWEIEALPQDDGVAPASSAVDVKAGLIYTALVLDKDKTSIQLVVQADAAAASGEPVGGVDTGMGGGARGNSGGTWTLGLLAVSTASIAGGLLFRRRSRLELG